MRKVTEFFFYITIFLLPTYLLRLTFFSISINLLDILETLSIGLCVLLLFQERNIKNYSIFKEKKWIILGFSCIALGAILSASLSGSISTREAGILKSWIFLPFLFIFSASLCGFSFRKAFFWGIASALCTGLIAFIFPDTFTYDGRLRGWYESPNQLAMIIAPMLIMTWFFYREKKKSISILLLIVFIFTGVLFWTHSLGALLATITSILVGEWLLWKQTWTLPSPKLESRNLTETIKKYKNISLIALLFICMGLLYMQEDFFKKDLFSDQSSLASREIIWRSAFHIALDSPFFGIGPGNFQEKYLEYQYFYAPYLEWAVPHPHNLFLTFWLFSGIFGIVGFILIIGNVGLTFLKNKKTADIFSVAVFCVLLSTLLHGLIDTTIWGNTLSIIFWLIILSDRTHS